MSTHDTLDLQQLDDTYEIIGELAGRDDGRTFIARRRADEVDVLILVVETPRGDEGNALSHLAADVNRLVSMRHRNLLAVLEGRWLGEDAFALVTERVYFPTLEELLSRRDETFSFARIATILQEVNAALEWARGQNIVHRAIALDTVFLEPGSDRVHIAFAIRALPLGDMPGRDDDLRTIATLARAMLTRSVADPERADVPLAKLRPGLPRRLIEQTELLLNPAAERDSQVRDATEYIAVIAMADALKKAETECEDTTRKLLEEERFAREKIEAERQATERAAAEQARLFQEEREAFATEKARIEQELQRQRDALAKERALLARQRQECGEDRAALLAEREEHKRWAEEVESRLESQEGELEEQSKRIAKEGAAAAALVEPRRVTLPPRPKSRRIAPEWQRAIARAWDKRPAWNRKWNVPAAAVGLLLLIGVSTVAIARGVDFGSRRQPSGQPLTQRRVVDSAAGGISRSQRPATPVSGIPYDFASAVWKQRSAGIPTDLISGVLSRRDSSAEGPATTPRRSQNPSSAPVPVTRVPVVSNRPVAAPRRLDTVTRIDTVFGPPAAVTPPLPVFVPPVRRDTLPRRDTIARPRPDSLAPVDTAPAFPWVP